MQLVCYLVLVYYVCSVGSMLSFWNDQFLPPLVQLCYELLLSPFVYAIWALEELRSMPSNDRPATQTPSTIKAAHLQ
jgi:hypothetical protein